MVDTLTLSVPKAAKLAGVGETTLREWIARGLPYVRSENGGKLYIPVDGLKEWIAQESKAQAAAAISAR